MHGREDAGGRARQDSGRDDRSRAWRALGAPCTSAQCARTARAPAPLFSARKLLEGRDRGPPAPESRRGPPRTSPPSPNVRAAQPDPRGTLRRARVAPRPSAPEAPALPGPSWRPSPGPRRPGLQAPCTSAGEPGLRIPEPRPFQTRLVARRMRREQSEFSGKSRPRRQMPGFSRAAKPSAEGSGGHGHCPPGDKDASCPKRRLGRALALTVSRERPLCAVGTDEEPGF